MLRAVLASTLVALLLGSCAPPPPRQRPDLVAALGDLDMVRERGVLRVLVPSLREASLPRQGHPATEDREMASAFATRLGVRAEFISVDSRTDLLMLLEQGYGDIVTAQLTVTAGRQKRVRFTRPTASVSEWLVGRRGAVSLPRSVGELDYREIHVRPSSAFAETIKNLARRTGVDVRIVPVEEELDTETIAYEVSQGRRPLTVARKRYSSVSIVVPLPSWYALGAARRRLALTRATTSRGLNGLHM